MNLTTVNVTCTFHIWHMDMPAVKHAYSVLSRCTVDIITPVEIHYWEKQIRGDPRPTETLPSTAFYLLLLLAEKISAPALAHYFLLYVRTALVCLPNQLYDSSFSVLAIKLIFL